MNKKVLIGLAIAVAVVLWGRKAFAAVANAGSVADTTRDAKLGATPIKTGSVAATQDRAAAATPLIRLTPIRGGGITLAPAISLRPESSAFQNPAAKTARYPYLRSISAATASPIRPDYTLTDRTQVIGT